MTCVPRGAKPQRPAVSVPDRVSASSKKVLSFPKLIVPWLPCVVQFRIAHGFADGDKNSKSFRASSERMMINNKTLKY
jgi:hypothetical protein